MICSIVTCRSLFPLCLLTDQVFSPSPGCWSNQGFHELSAAPVQEARLEELPEHLPPLRGPAPLKHSVRQASHTPHFSNSHCHRLTLA